MEPKTLAEKIMAAVISLQNDGSETNIVAVWNRLHTAHPDVRGKVTEVELRSIAGEHLVDNPALKLMGPGSIHEAELQQTREDGQARDRAERKGFATGGIARGPRVGLVGDGGTHSNMVPSSTEGEEAVIPLKKGMIVEAHFKPKDDPEE